MDNVAVIDFETTGLSPGEGARATEIAAVLIRNGRVVERYQSLMNAGVAVPPFIESLTGISNDMIRRAPAASKVMNEVAEFVGDFSLVAHNASFDRTFWDAELKRVRKTRREDFVCSMLVARRVYPDCPNHKLHTLVEFAKLPAGRYHRAMADAEMTAALLLRMEQDLVRRYRLKEVTHQMLQAIQMAPRHQLDTCIERFLKKACSAGGPHSARVVTES